MMRRTTTTFLLVATLVAVTALPVRAFTAGLGGSPASMLRQHAVAVEEDYAFLRTPTDVQKEVEHGTLVHVAGGADYVLSGVSFAETRPEVLTFIELFAADYHRATGARLVVTSLTRPTVLQPRNAHKLSVHPAGMAVDFRVPADATSRAYLEGALLSMERDGLLDVTRERSPAHYHVAVFAEPFLGYADRRAAERVAAEREAARVAAVARARSAAARAGTTREPERNGNAMLAGLSVLLAAVPVSRRLRHARRRRRSDP